MKQLFTIAGLLLVAALDVAALRSQPPRADLPLASTDLAPVALAGVPMRWPRGETSYFTPVGERAAHAGIAATTWRAIMAEAGLPGRDDTATAKAFRLLAADTATSQRWDAPRPGGEPPVASAVHLERTVGPRRLWRDRSLAFQRPIYVTFAARSDLYVRCYEHEIGRPREACMVYWFDGCIVHSWPVPGDLVEVAPRVQDAYAALVATR